ncbi:hypothetical protein AA14337_3145 [Acetobacter malorum DSM 14337]|uniref:Uncharacterized protein n=1 Tax=Acetobacter malorum DSM 14337 TaxID=1307910 RepID=A0ABQ0PZX7_9PROT|nr:hypothetical protein [Acetobacter malorum]KXV05723.1 hypothetical protein AD930_11365 [Acetobacter malorum]GBQ85718.1 hypothetical protein AA14337_3145 [Acetobacter malorum DSM 14337]
MSGAEAPSSAAQPHVATIWYRVIWRKKAGRGFSKTEDESLIEVPENDAGAFQREIAKLPGQVVTHGRAKQHICSVCSKAGPWKDGWGWYGSYQDIDNGNEVLKTCSDACKAQAQKEGRIPNDE